MTKPPRVRQRARRDRNHNEICRAFESVGATVLDVSSVGGALDLIVGAGGIDQRVEVKDGEKTLSKKKLTPPEVEVFQLWRGRKPVVVESVDDAINLINQLRREANAAMG
jgi:hypothetical protein